MDEDLTKLPDDELRRVIEDAARDCKLTKRIARETPGLIAEAYARLETLHKEWNRRGLPW